MCRDWRKGALLYVFLEHFQTSVLRSGSRESQEVRKMQTLLCTAEPLAVSKEEVPFYFCCSVTRPTWAFSTRSGILRNIYELTIQHSSELE